MVFRAALLAQRRAFTLIELLVVISIIAILASLLMPAISVVQSMSKASKCGSNLRQIYTATLAYTDDNEGQLPPAILDRSSGLDTFWFGLIGPYADAARGSSGSVNNLRQSSVIWGCPSYKKDPAIMYGCGYGMNHWLRNPWVSGNPRYTSYQLDGAASNATYGLYTVFTLDSVEYPATRPLFGDAHTWALPPGANTPARHRKNLMVGFCDGHVEGMLPARLRALRDDPSGK